MSLKEGISQCEAERRFWRRLELVEHLLPFLDLASTKELAGAHKLTRQILGRAINWNKVVKRTFPASKNINMIRRNLMEENDPILASERPKVRLLAQILRLVEDSEGPELEMNLLHTICGHYPSSRVCRAQLLLFADTPSVTLGLCPPGRGSECPRIKRAECS